MKIRTEAMKKLKRAESAIKGSSSKGLKEVREAKGMKHFDKELKK